MLGSATLQAMKCLACGSTNLVEGYVMDSNGTRLCFQFANRSTLKAMFGVGQRPLALLACMHCGATQARVDFTDSDRKDNARFDSPPPSITDPEQSAG
jgi:hypothetical protein